MNEYIAEKYPNIAEWIPEHILEDPTADLSLSACVRIGKELEALGKAMLNDAKYASPTFKNEQPYEEDGILFEWRRTHTQVRVDSRHMKANFPPEDYPDLYKEVQVAGTVMVKEVN